MVNKYNKAIISILFSFFVISCRKYVSKETVKLKLDAALLSQPNFCKDKILSGELATLYEPEVVGKNIGIFNGNIYQFGSDPINSISISDTNSNWIDKTRKSLFKNKETLDAAQKTYENYVSELKIDNLCSPSSNSMGITLLNEKIKTNSYSRIFIFSKSISDSVWNGYPIYKNISILKDSLIKIYGNSKGASILIIVDPISLPSENPELVTDTIRNPGNEDPVPPSKDYESIKNILKRVSNQSISFEERMNVINDVMQSTFSKDFEVESYIDNKGVASHYWDKGHGRKYLESLATDKSILDFKIEAVTRSKDDNKVLYLQVTEIHN